MTTLTPELLAGLRAKHVKPCPENGVSHDCAHEYVMWMPADVLDALLARIEELTSESVKLRDRPWKLISGYTDMVPADFLSPHDVGELADEWEARAEKVEAERDELQARVDKALAIALEGTVIEYPAVRRLRAALSTPTPTKEQKA